MLRIFETTENFLFNLQENVILLSIMLRHFVMLIHTHKALNCLGQESMLCEPVTLISLYLLHPASRVCTAQANLLCLIHYMKQAPRQNK